MDKQIATKVEPDQARKEALERCKEQIVQGKRRGREAIKTIAKALQRIYNDELWKDEGYNSFNAFSEGELYYERHTTANILAAADTIKTLEDAGIIEIPAIEAQLVVLNRIPAEKLAEVWEKGLGIFEEKGWARSTDNIKKLVDGYFANLPQAKKPKVNPTIDMGNGERRSFSEDAEVALERIGRLAGAEVKEAIESGVLPISERDLIKWSEESDQMVHNLAYYIVDQRWTLAKSLQYESQLITEGTTLIDLAHLATARGGEYGAELDANKTTFELYIKKKK